MQIMIKTDRKCEKCGQAESRTFDSQEDALEWLDNGCNLAMVDGHSVCKVCKDAYYKHINDAAKAASDAFFTPALTVVTHG